jgi:pimeloyl-ACP methyl ester carboxylesterase
VVTRLHQTRFDRRTKTKDRATISLPKLVATHDRERHGTDGPAKIFKENNVAENEISPAEMAVTEFPPLTLVVNGSTDLIIYTVNSFILQQNLPNAELIIYPDSAHGGHHQYPKLFVRHASMFLSANDVWPAQASKLNNPPPTGKKNDHPQSLR